MFAYQGRTKIKVGIFGRHSCCHKEVLIIIINTDYYYYLLSILDKMDLVVMEMHSNIIYMYYDAF